MHAAVMQAAVMHAAVTILMNEAPVETTGYMVAGYGVIFGLIGLYLASLWLRQRRLRQDLATLEELAN